MKMYEKYIYPIAETYAWVLMKNHFHFLIRLKVENEIKVNALPNLVRVSNPDRVQSLKEPHLYFSHLFNAYTQAFNKKHHRHGSLFERPLKRLLIENEKYLRNVVVYIHQNPVYHGFVEHIPDYPWSSYLTLVSVKPTKLSRQTVLGWFDDVGNFKYMHEKDLDDDSANFVIE
jgi:REP element-mobilizing transposase RayT